MCYKRFYWDMLIFNVIYFYFSSTVYINQTHTFQKSSVSEKNPCECFNTGFEHCVIYPKDVCNCSASCAFVQEYLQGNRDDSAEILSMRTFSKLITPMPGYDDNVFEESREGEKVSFKTKSML